MIYRHLETLNDGVLSEAALRGIFREILSASRFLQTPTTVAFLGPEASFTHQAALAHFGGGIAAVPTVTIPEVFEEVERGKQQWGIVPVENSAEGSVKTTLDCLISTPLSIRAEVYLRIRHCLLASCEDPDAIRKVYSHPQALAQCQVWLRTHLPGVPLVEVESTAGAARRVREDKRAAAVASRLAAETYGLNLLAEGIEDNPANTTRFLVIGPRAGKGSGGITGRDRSSILFGTPHVPGALQRALGSLRRGGDQSDAHRIVPDAGPNVGIPLFCRLRRTYRRGKDTGVPCGVEKQDRLPQDPGVLSPGGGAAMICIPIAAMTTDAAIEKIERAGPLADLIELRIDRIPGVDLERLLAARRTPVIVTNRRREEGGGFTGTEEERVETARRSGATGRRLCRYRDGHRSRPEVRASGDDCRNLYETDRLLA